MSGVVEFSGKFRLFSGVFPADFSGDFSADFLGNFFIFFSAGLHVEDWVKN